MAALSAGSCEILKSIVQSDLQSDLQAMCWECEKVIYCIILTYDKSYYVVYIYCTYILYTLYTSVSDFQYFNFGFEQLLGQCQKLLRWRFAVQVEMFNYLRASKCFHLDADISEDMSDMTPLCHLKVDPLVP